MASQKCIVAGCKNHAHEGVFVNGLCSPCYGFLTKSPASVSTPSAARTLALATGFNRHNEVTENTHLYAALTRMQEESNKDMEKYRALKARYNELESILMSVNREKTKYLNELVVLRAEAMQQSKEKPAHE